MANLKSLFKDTAIYGLSSIIGRFLNYLLVPLYTAKISAASGGYGVITNVYAYTALLLVLLTFGMETTFFRYANKEGMDAKKVYGTTLWSVGGVSALFAVVVLLFLNPIAAFQGYANHPEYIATMALTVAIDSTLCIPFDYLRLQKRPIKFATIKLINIAMLIVLNCVAYLFIGVTDVKWVFYINLFCSAFQILLLAKELTGFKFGFDTALLKKMLSYSWPILVLGIAGILNQTADKILFPFIYEKADAHTQLGIYGAASKIAMIMAMITQAFRLAYEPFVFGQNRQKDNRETYAQAMKFFIIFTLLAFLFVIGYMDLLRHIIAPDYWDGLNVVPIVMAAEIMMGIYFNLSFWYKLIDKTIWGAVFSGIGCAVLIAINVIFVPRYGYIACAWGGFAGYGVAMLTSYIVGQKYYPINYHIKDIMVYVVAATIIYAVMSYCNDTLPNLASMCINTLLIVGFMALIVKKDMPLSSLPVIGKKFRK